ncbi:MAG: quinolinate synthase NadA [Vallitaleaceae bacterium]|nr:quinolinate synthase NadA [Vallitaleaceae bacterium]
MIEEIKQLKEERDAIIMAHYYQSPEIQRIADIVGDSLALAKEGAKVKEKTIVLCGVRFMAESAKILSPEKTVLIPRADAGCPMADMITDEQLVSYKRENPDRWIVSYVNTTALVKTYTDVCVTSSNALKVMKQLKGKKILFLPDKNLGAYIQSQLPDMDIELWPGFCITHHQLAESTIQMMKEQHPSSMVLAHPECNSQVLQHADFIGSTKDIIDFASSSKAKQFLIATEEGILHPLQENNPEKEFLLASDRLVCRNMKKTKLIDVRDCLKNMQTEILLEETVIQKAKKPLDAMLSYS